MTNPFTTKYRIRPNYYTRYKIQVRPWWWPFWFDESTSNSFEELKLIIKNCKENNIG